jgi:hypothetical protein
VKRADPVLPNDEQALWDSGVFNIDLSTGFLGLDGSLFWVIRFTSTFLLFNPPCTFLHNLPV